MTAEQSGVSVAIQAWGDVALHHATLLFISVSTLYLRRHGLLKSDLWWRTCPPQASQTTSGRHGLSHMSWPRPGNALAFTSEHLSLQPSGFTSDHCKALL